MQKLMEVVSFKEGEGEHTHENTGEKDTHGCTQGSFHKPREMYFQ